MPTFGDLPFTERLIAAHPSLAHRQMGEVVLSTLRQNNPLQQIQRRRAERSVQPVNAAFQQALGNLADSSLTRIVQIGAHDGKSDDPLSEGLNTKKWSAILVEPAADAFDALEQFRGKRPDTTLINKAISPQAVPITLYSPVIKGYEHFGSVWTSTDRQQVVREVKRNLGSHMLRHTKIEVLELDTISPRDLLTDQGIAPNEIDVLVCDIEGQDPGVVNAFMDFGVKPRVLMYEHLHADSNQTSELVERLHEEGYENILQSVKDTVAIY